MTACVDATRWNALREALDERGEGTISDAAVDAARALLANHENVLRDVINPSTKTNIDGIPLTQLHLQRVDPGAAVYVDQAMRETVRRLLGAPPGPMEERMDPWNASQVHAWSSMASYLDGRLHSRPEEKPGRTPDMSPEAAAAMRKVLHEIGHMGITTTLACAAPKWQLLRATRGWTGGAASPIAEGAASELTHEAREEAARALLANHENVLRDVTNPSPKTNIDGIPLTQLHLQRVDISVAVYVDQAMRETVRRLLGRLHGIDLLEERLDPNNTAQARAWVGMASYLDGRLHSRPEEKPGRTPDMSPAAAAAMRTVLHEVGTMAMANTLSADGPQSKWLTLRQLLQSSAGLPASAMLVDGVACDHSKRAREEAARKLIQNHRALLNDVTNPAPLTQTHLKRIPRSLALHVDRAQREIARRLLGRRKDSLEAALLDTHLEEKLDVNDPVQVAAWAGMATYLNTRIQATPEECGGRTPDFSLPAADAFKAVLKEVGIGVSLSGGMMRGSIPMTEIKVHKGGCVIS